MNWTALIIAIGGVIGAITALIKAVSAKNEAVDTTAALSSHLNSVGSTSETVTGQVKPDNPLP